MCANLAPLASSSWTAVRCEVVITPDEVGGLDGAAAVRERRVTQIDLKELGNVALRGVAYNPANGHLYVLSPAEQKGYELTETGAVVSTLDLAPLKLNDPQAIVFAPSADATDDPAIMNLYIADRGLSSERSQETRPGSIVEVSLTPPVLVALPASIQASLVQIIDPNPFLLPHNRNICRENRKQYHPFI